MLAADVDVRDESDGDPEEADNLLAVEQLGFDQVERHLAEKLTRNFIKLIPLVMMVKFWWFSHDLEVLNSSPATSNFFPYELPLMSCLVSAHP